MRKQIIRISIHQSSKVLSIFAALIATVFAIIPLALYTLVNGELIAGLIMLFIAPIFYGIFFYVLYAVSFLIYNFIAKHLGGLEFDLEALDSETVSPKQDHHMDHL